MAGDVVRLPTTPPASSAAVAVSGKGAETGPAPCPVPIEVLEASAACAAVSRAAEALRYADNALSDAVVAARVDHGQSWAEIARLLYGDESMRKTAHRHYGPAAELYAMGCWPSADDIRDGDFWADRLFGDFLPSVADGTV